MKFSTLRHLLTRSLLSLSVLGAAALAPALAQFQPPGGGMADLDLSSEQRAALRQAAGECRRQNSGRDGSQACLQQKLGSILTSEQKSKLERNRPDGDGPPNLSQDQQSAFKAAIEQCRQQNQDRQAVRSCLQQKMGDNF
ncbi:hypothetical protein [Gloeobacter morelensis]|uniref:Uncharacterized protein n=1 Tax=Gloeobacter morelensis MG652769 TaxID=2781736 RepID=A0ABY3PGF3_9CYAN|nr:hypothetical protein [Gloeobacter morelensis]UFP92720.1 hypothetical protein ISF26_12830 [Gloeobacter morelensis MG652769]